MALFTFVARNPLTQKSTQLNPLQPQTAEEKQLFQERQQVADARKAARSASAADQQEGKQCLQSTPVSHNQDSVCALSCEVVKQPTSGQ